MIAPLIQDRELYRPDMIINFISNVTAYPEDILELFITVQILEYDLKLRI